MTENRSAGDHAPHASTEPAEPAGPAGPERIVRVGSPSSLLALVPHLLEFEPRMSIVVLGTAPPRGRVRLTLRFDLPKRPDKGAAAELARRALAVMMAQGLTSGVAVGYGPGRLVTPVADALRRQAGEAGFHLNEVMRAQDGRYWSYLCTQPGCCAAEGVPYDVSGHPVTAAFAKAGRPPVLASREELAATVAAIGGPAGDAMATATRQAQERLGQLVVAAAASGRRGAARRLLATSGVDAVRAAIGLYRDGGELTSDDDAAWLSAVLQDLRVRDDAWARMDPEHADDHRRLWTDLTRRARPGFVAPAASLLAFVAWQAGNGALANVALDRAQGDDPDYSMASLLREVIDSGVPPQRARLPMTPEEVAESYDRAEQEEYGDPGYDDCELGDAGDSVPA